jgi:hypothetical protein
MALDVAAEMERTTGALAVATVEPAPASAPALPKRGAPSTRIHPAFVRTGVYARPQRTRWQRWSRPLLGLMLLLLVVAGTRTFAAFHAADDELTVRIEAQQPVTLTLGDGTTGSPYLYGTNVAPATGTQANGDDASGYMPYDASTVAGLRDAGVTMLRFPGGNWGDSNTPSLAQINALLALAQKTGATPLMQVRLTGGTPADAAALVSYTNNPHNPARQQFPGLPFVPVHYWVIGDEPDLIGPGYTVADYVRDYIAFATAMKRVDPTIRILGPELSVYNGLDSVPRDSAGVSWLDGFLKGVAAYEQNSHEQILDGVTVHDYPLGAAPPSDGLLFSSADSWRYALPQLERRVAQIMGQNLPVGVTEINATAAGAASPTPLAAALWWADTLGTLGSEGATYVDFSSARSAQQPSSLLNGVGTVTPLARVMQLYRHMEPDALPVEVAATPVGIYAATDAAQDRVSLMLVNKSPNQVTVSVDPVRAFSSWSSRELTVPPYAVVCVVMARGGGESLYVYAPTAQDLSAGQAGTIVAQQLP